MHPPEIQGSNEDRPTIGDHLSEEGRGPDDPACEPGGPPLPPGQHPYDPVKKDLDPIAFALYRVQTFLAWIDEHRAAFEKARGTGEEFAEAELSNLRDATRQGMIHLQRLSELLLAGYTIDPGKRLPESLRRGWFASRVRTCDERGRASEGEASAGSDAAAHPPDGGEARGPGAGRGAGNGSHLPLPSPSTTTEAPPATN